MIAPITMPRMALTILGPALCFFLAAQQGADGQHKKPPKSPTAVVKAFLAAHDAKNPKAFAKADGCLTEKAREMARLLRELNPDPPFTTLSVTGWKETVEGPKATVTAEASLERKRPGRKETEKWKGTLSALLRREKGEWRIHAFGEPDREMDFEDEKGLAGLRKRVERKRQTYEQDPELAARIRKEVDAWITTLPPVALEENGALLITDGAARLSKMPKALQLCFQARQGSFDRSDEKLRREGWAYLKANAQALALVEKGLAMKKFRYTTDYQKGHKATVPNHPAMRRAAASLILRGHLALNYSDALGDYLLALRLANTLTRHAHGIGWCSGSVLLRMAVKALLPVLSREALPLSVLETAHATLAREYALRGSFQNMMDVHYRVEQLLPLARFAESKTGLRSNYKLDYEVFGRHRAIFAKADPGRYFEAPAALRDNTMYKTLGLRDYSPAVVALSLSGFGRSILVMSSWDLMLWRGVRVLCALRLWQARHDGQVPGELSQLDSLVPSKESRDPFSGNIFVYSRLGSSRFLLYGTGPDGKENSGEGSLVTSGAPPSPHVWTGKDYLFHDDR